MNQDGHGAVDSGTYLSEGSFTSASTSTQCDRQGPCIHKSHNVAGQLAQAHVFDVSFFCVSARVDF